MWAGHTAVNWLRRIRCCESWSLICSVILFNCSNRPTTAVLPLISVFVYPLLLASSFHHVALIQMSSNCSICLINLFRSNGMTSFKFWHPIVKCKNPSMRQYYSQLKVFAVEMLHKYWPSDWESFLSCTCWMRSSGVLERSKLIHRTPNF